MKCYIRENWLYIRNLYYYSPATVMDCSPGKRWRLPVLEYHAVYTNMYAQGDGLPHIITVD